MSGKSAFPLWVIVLGAIIVAVVVTVLIVHLTGNGMAGMHG
ncbi:hypothetical protein ACH3VR_14245 [Microbacterium sp. B2969]|uniref:Uncharacterized protein n=1 Tax=Microbacterium alkaliflavum TaxID=3248839 RepID=A0ABW7Q9I0_9MICO